MGELQRNRFSPRLSDCDSLKYPVPDFEFSEIGFAKSGSLRRWKWSYATSKNLRKEWANNNQRVYDRRNKEYNYRWGDFVWVRRIEREETVRNRHWGPKWGAIIGDTVNSMEVGAELQKANAQAKRAHVPNGKTHPNIISKKHLCSRGQNQE